MRPFLKGCLWALAMHGLITLAAAAQTSVVVMTWGGPFMDALNEVRPDIEKSTGTKI